MSDLAEHSGDEAALNAPEDASWMPREEALPRWTRLEPVPRHPCTTISEEKYRGGEPWEVRDGYERFRPSQRSPGWRPWSTTTDLGSTPGYNPSQQRRWSPPEMCMPSQGPLQSGYDQYLRQTNYYHPVVPQSSFPVYLRRAGFFDPVSRTYYEQ